MPFGKPPERQKNVEIVRIPECVGRPPAQQDTGRSDSIPADPPGTRLPRPLPRHLRPASREFLAALVAAGQLKVHAQVAVQVRLGAVEVKVADGDAADVTADAGIYRHPEHLEAAVKAGKHVYIEKPAAVDVAGCRRVIRAADSADRRLNVAFGFQQRYGPCYRKAKALVDSGGIGAIRMAHSHWIKGAVTGSEKPVPRPQTEEEGVRQCHSRRDTHGDNMDHCDVTFTYGGNVAAMLSGSQIAPRFYRSVNEQFFGAAGVVETAREYWKHYRDKADPVMEKEPRDITVDALEGFVRRIREGTPENTGVQSAESTLTAIMGRMAIDLKREVTWEEVLKS